MSMTFNVKKASSREKGYPCILCGNTDAHVIWDKSAREQLDILASVVIRDDEGNIVQGRVVMCKKCGLIYTDPKMTEIELAKFYRTEYREIYYSSDKDQLHSEAGHSSNAFEILKRYIDIENLNKQTEGQLKFLDVGASTLRMCTGIKNIFGDKVRAVAVEPSTEYTSKGIEHNKKTNLPVDIEIYNSTIENAAIDGMKFDFVTCLNTLEHAHNPRKVLERIHNCMDEKSILIVAVPTLFNISPVMAVDAWLSNAHLYHFTPQTLSLLAIECGFKPLELIGTTEEVGEKMYAVLEKDVKKPVQLDKVPNYGLIRQFLLEQDSVYMSRMTLINGGYYCNG